MHATAHMSAMKSRIYYLPLLTTIIACLLMLAHGPIAQLPHYHEFADQSAWLGIPHAGDVLSNLPFAVIALWGLVRLWPHRYHPALYAGRYGYALFLFGLLLTAIGSSYYHLAPDDAHIVWDRLPIALLCAGLLAAVRAENLQNENGRVSAFIFAILAVISVDWWRMTAQHGVGDLRPYLLLQILPMLLIPMWQAIYRAPQQDRVAYAAAIACYVFAKLAELNDHAIQALTGSISGHTIKHLLAALAAACIVNGLMRRVGENNDYRRLHGFVQSKQNRPH
jgi:hypothetical protein